MKTNREFIDGIYEKAKNYENSEDSTSFDLGNVTFLDTSLNQKRAKLQFVACLTLVLLTGIGYSNSNFIKIDKMELPQEISNNYQYLGFDDDGMAGISRTSEPHIMSLGEDLYYNPIEQSEVICTAKVVKIEKSNYDEKSNFISTNVIFETFETIKGSINQEFKLLVTGGVDELNKVYLDYEEVFELNEHVLLFLETSHSDPNLYILAGASLGKYSLADNQIYENEAGIQYTINDLKTHFSLN